MILTLTRGDSGVRVPLQLPATEEEICMTYDYLCSISEDSSVLRILEMDSPVSFLNQHYWYYAISGPEALKGIDALAEKIDRMDEEQLKTYDGALRSECVDDLSDFIRVAESLKDYIFVNGVTTEKELGRFLVDTGYKGFSEEVKPYLDYAAIGAEYYAERGGAFSGSGYTLRRGSAEPIVSGQESKPVFTVSFDTGAEGSLFQVQLPADEEQLENARVVLGVEDLKKARIVRVKFEEESLSRFLPLDSPDLASLIMVAEVLNEAHKNDNFFKAMAVLDMEKPKAMRDAAELLSGLDRYEFVQGSEEQYGRDALYDLCGDQDIVNEVDGFMDWNNYGLHRMEQDGIRQTEFGAIRAVERGGPEMDLTM